MLAKKKQNNISASVADEHLVLSLPNATEPVIWRKSLDQIGSASFEVKKASKEELYNLTLKKTKTTSETIASFTNKEDAVDALNAASNAFHAGPVTPKVSANQNDSNPKGGRRKWLYALLALGIVIGLYMYMISLIPDQTIFTDSAGTSTSTPESRGPITPESTGVPVSADDFLDSLQ
ncbi:MAG: hypothetical protein AAF244_01955 [Pseudomonadota bacterium]